MRSILAVVAAFLIIPAALNANPAVAGDYPDPSVIRDERGFWSTATSSEWGSHFPILFSKDMKQWELKGSVFPERPEWTQGNFWAPEIAHLRGKYVVYYTARKKGATLCVAVATADQPEGPYTDHGPLMCQGAGSIDAFAIEDGGKLWLFWKEDGNSRKLPTPIWAQELSDDGLKLVGEKKEVLRNDPETWEGNLIEGEFIVKRADYFYMFYAGNACCGHKCNYGTGVARSKNLLGPYEKNPANPILKGNSTWTCPGHGSIVNDGKGHDFFMYHAYSAQDGVYVGRQVMIDEVQWGADGWPTINDGTPGTGESAPMASYDFATSFTANELEPGWQWPQANKPETMQTGKSGLVLGSHNLSTTDPVSTILARSTVGGNYVAETLVQLPTSQTAQSALPHARGGIAIIGDKQNAQGLSCSHESLVLWEKRKGEVLEKTKLHFSAAVRTIHLRVTAQSGHLFQFSYSTDGISWKDFGEQLDGEYLPPWDRGLRVALTTNMTVKFQSFSLKAK